MATSTFNCRQPGNKGQISGILYLIPRYYLDQWGESFLTAFRSLINLIDRTMTRRQLTREIMFLFRLNKKTMLHNVFSTNCMKKHEHFEPRIQPHPDLGSQLFRSLNSWGSVEKMEKCRKNQNPQSLWSFSGKCSRSKYLLRLPQS